ncbi:proline dehydrogenase [Pullulanibacillus sp. KACC 23026]|uniref:proline dehydrogenase n=1 Tax=Pullulanibacillus sp. KACC 23026 TaxID=3028315 RepID=UPI0023B1C6EF|nr:proline dehydrogenase [Pullulanibacillus sp. KACC 23026]WEG12957.1 proline dehydrogenase [Pullulanibacillus sp. KACC 23026]
MLAAVSKSFFYALSENKSLNKAAKKWGFRFGAGQVVAGVDIESAIRKVKELNDLGITATLDHLGEFVSSREEATESTDYCIKVLEAIAESGVKSTLSVKMTQLGLDIDQEFCFENMCRILETAKTHDLFVQIDMEDFKRCQITLDMVKRLRQTYDNVGTVIQGYLYRSEEDLDQLNGVVLRLVKGAYKEPAEVAFQEKSQVDDNYWKLIQKRLLEGTFTAIGSHDHNIINKVKAFAKEHHIPNDQFEFQMLYGFRTELQEQLVKEGYNMRVYIPFGTDWFGYFMRRLAERPQNVSFALKGLLSK